MTSIAEGVWVVELPLPHRGVVETTNCYLLADDAGGVHLVDPGWDTPDNHARLEAGLTDAGFALDDVRSVTATHLHPDHLGLGSRLRSERGVPVALHRLEHEALTRPLYPEPDETIARWGIPADFVDEVRANVLPRSQPPGLAADVVLEDGDLLPLPGRAVRVVHTPGHTVGSICLHDESAALLMTGDHVLPIVNPGLGLGGFLPDDDPLGLALDSYARMAAYDDAEVLPGHGVRFHGVATRATQIADRHRRRGAEIAALVDADPGASVWQIASRVNWTGGWEALVGFLRLSALSQTEMHLRHLARRGTLGK
ncbi:MBL fold metallo-hydrolase [Pseudolysinimonas sp.]|uniref:MBL fold metallo-hydrolase n=1 Tax=Pseudolysinimonas sp. TaxID=2680009 RepID=UPI0037846A82